MEAEKIYRVVFCCFDLTQPVPRGDWIRHPDLRLALIANEIDVQPLVALL